MVTKYCSQEGREGEGKAHAIIPWLFIFLGFFNIKYVHSAMVTGYTKQFWIMVKVDTVSESKEEGFRLL